MTRDEICTRFLDDLPFDPYPFQEEALLAWFGESEGLMVTAPTGMGKTFIAEAAIYEALHSGTRLYYTTPLIALTDQKFREFQAKAEQWGFSHGDIGLITGNRRVNPEARIRVVVAEILLNHQLSEEESFHDVSGVVMDEFHFFNDLERGVVWELSLVLLPKNVRLMLLSATVGNARPFITWLKTEHGRSLDWIHTDERRVPLEFIWVGDALLNDHLENMCSEKDVDNRTPALVFCFNRDECWEVAEQLKGRSLISKETQARIDELLPRADFEQGVGPKLREMLRRGVGVHHAGVLPKHKEVIENLFTHKLIPFVICTETLAAGINLPARSVVLRTLLKGKPREKKLIPAAGAHQMFGRAGRPQYDAKGYVYAMAHEDDVKIHKWRLKYEKLDLRSKDPGLLRQRKQLEHKRPTRRATQQYWTEGQFKSLIEAGPGKLQSVSMIPYQVLIYLLVKFNSLQHARNFLSKRFNTPDRLEDFQRQLDRMIANLQALGYLTLSEDGEHVELHESIFELTHFRSVDPLYGTYLARRLNYSDYDEKVIALESVLPLAPVLLRKVRLPEDREPGPLETNLIRPELIQLGKLSAGGGPSADDDEEDDGGTTMWEDEEEREPTFPEMLKIAFNAQLPSEEPIEVFPKWIAGGIRQMENDFYKFVKNRQLEKQEGLVLRHLLRLVILTGEFHEKTQDPDYLRMGELATQACRQVDERYTDRFLAEAEQIKSLLPG